MTTINDILDSTEIRWLNSTTNISLKHKYVYFENPKVACSSIKLNMQEIESIGITGIPKIAHPDVWQSVLLRPFQLPPDLLDSVFFGKEFFRFTFVRNPFDRALSAYLDKVQKKEKDYFQIKHRWKESHKQSKEEFTFCEFLETIKIIPDIQRNKHWRSQSNVTMFDLINYSFIGQLEKFDSDMNKLRYFLGHNIGTTKHAPHQTSAADRRREYYGEKETRLCLEIFANDFKNFSYPRKP